MSSSVRCDLFYKLEDLAFTKGDRPNPFTIFAAVFPIYSEAQVRRPDQMTYPEHTFGRTFRHARNTKGAPTQPLREVQEREVLRTLISNNSADNHDQSSQTEPTTDVFKKYVTWLLLVFGTTVARADFRIVHAST